MGVDRNGVVVAEREQAHAVRDLGADPGQCAEVVASLVVGQARSPLQASGLPEAGLATCCKCSPRKPSPEASNRYGGIVDSLSRLGNVK